jgi:hypothetical protein
MRDFSQGCHAAVVVLSASNVLESDLGVLTASGKWFRRVLAAKLAGDHQILY